MAKAQRGGADTEVHDVVVVGASIAGSVAAAMYAREGLRVALVEKHADPQHYKRLCTHFIQGSARPTLERLGVASELEAVGAVRNGVQMWTRWGWVVPPESGSWGYNLRRHKLDPILRRAALDSDRVEGFLGWRVRGLVRQRGRVNGVVVEDRDRNRRRLLARLVVGADGANSTVAELAGARAAVSENERFGYYTHYRGVGRDASGRSTMWFLEPDIAYAFPNDDDVTVLACMPSKRWLAAFDQDRQGTFERFMGSLPHGPDLSRAEQVAALMGTRDQPLRRRPVAPVPGVALVGDAATTSDPVWGVGCGWACQSAEWLVTETAQALRNDCDGLAAAIRRYRRRHRHIDAHHFLVGDFATGRDFNPIELTVFSAATRDDAVASSMERFGTRTAPASIIIRPSTLLRAARANRSHARSAGSAPPWRRAEGVRRGRVTVEGLATPVLESGPPDVDEAVVCVHGNPGSCEDWGPLVEAVGPYGRAIAVDMPGFGNADKPEGFDHTISGHARHLAACLAELDVRRAHLVLHDFGGPWGLQFAANHPDTVGSLTLVDTGVTLGYRWHQLARIWQTPMAGEAVMATTTRPAFRMLLNLGCPRGLPDGFVDQLYDDFDADTRRAVLALYRATPDLDQALDPIRDDLRRLDVPTHVVWGRHDPYLPLAQAHRQHDTFPHARLSVLDHSGHWPFADDPVRFRATVLPFLQEQILTAVSGSGARPR